MTIAILEELVKSNPSSIIDLYEADFESVGDLPGSIHRFFSDTTQVGTQVFWNGNEYQSIPIEIDGFEWNGSGQLPSPKLKIANINGIVTALNQQYSDLLGLKITRIRTMLKYLDSVNFSSPPGTADPTAKYPDEIYYIDRKVSENSAYIEYDLVSALDISSVKLPRRLIIQNLCAWRYKGTDGNCGYIPSLNSNRMFDEYGNAVVDEALDVCGKKLSDCKARFGATATLNYGGFPGAGLLR